MGDEDVGAHLLQRGGEEEALLGEALEPAPVPVLALHPGEELLHLWGRVGEAGGVAGVGVQGGGAAHQLVEDPVCICGKTLVLFLQFIFLKNQPVLGAVVLGGHRLVPLRGLAVGAREAKVQRRRSRRHRWRRRLK